MAIDKAEEEEEILDCMPQLIKGNAIHYKMTTTRKLIKKVIRLCVYECKNIKGIGRAMAKNAATAPTNACKPPPIDGGALDSLGWMDGNILSEHG